MSRVTMSALLADARNKIGDVVFSKWKGVNYVRTRVVPANPKTANQVAQRNALTLCVASWKNLVSAVRSEWDRYAKGKNLSGFNAFCSANIADERIANWLGYTPSNPLVGRPGAVSAAATANPGELSLSWTLGDADASDQLVVAYRKTEDPRIVELQPAAATIGDGSYLLTGLDSAQEYVVYIAALDATNGYSQSQATTGTPL